MIGLEAQDDNVGRAEYEISGRGIDIATEKDWFMAVAPLPL